MGLRDKLKHSVDFASDAAGAVGHYAENVGGQVVEGLEDIVVDGGYGIVKDLFVDPFNDIRHHRPPNVIQAFGGALTSLVDVVEGVGTIVLSPVPGAAGAVGTGLEYSAKPYTEGVDPALATALTAGSLADSRGGVDQLWKSSTWTDAHKIVNEEDRSLGGAFALMFTDDITDEQEVAEFQKGAFYKTVSGTLDVIAPFFLDPMIGALKGVAVARRAALVKPLAGRVDHEQLFASQRIEKVIDELVGKSPAEIQHRFPSFAPGLPELIAKAGGDRELIRLELRSGGGDLEAINKLGRKSAFAANEMRRLKGERKALRAAGWTERAHDKSGQMFLLSQPDEIGRINAELKELHNEQLLHARRVAVFASFDSLPRASVTGNVRYNVTRSDWYYKAQGAPLRVIYRMRAHGIANLDDPAGDVQVHRLMEHSYLPQVERDAHRNTYIEAKTTLARKDALVKAEEAAVRSILTRYNISEGDQLKVVAQAAKGRSVTEEVLKQRAYAGKGKSQVELRGEGWPTDIPLMVAQNANIVPVVDLAKVEAVARRWGNTSRFVPQYGKGAQRAETFSADLADEILTSFHKLWKASVLLRAAYPLRVVGEEQVRIMSLFGAMTTGQWVKNGYLNKREDIALVGERVNAAKEAYATEHGVAPSKEVAARIKREIKADYRKNERIRGFRNLEIDGYDTPDPLGGDGRMYEQLLDSKASFDRSFGRDQEGVFGRLKKATGQFTDDVPPALPGGQQNPSWGPSWLNAVNRQIGYDSASKLILQGKSDEYILRWLESPGGAKYQAELDIYARRNPDHWIESLRGLVDSYLPTPALREAALQRKASLDLAVKEMPTAADRPTVHGEILAQHLSGQSKAVEAVTRFTEAGFKWIVQLPTNILSRNQLFNRVYQQEMQRRISVLEPQVEGRLTQAQVNMLAHGARQKALATTKKYLYDLAEESDLSHMVRFIAPFFNAWQEVLTTWGRLTVQNPAFSYKLKLALNAPERAGLMEENSFGQKVVVIPVPDFMRKVPLLGKALTAWDAVTFSTKSVNLILQGAPGAGPLGQILAYEIIKDRPDLGSDKAMKLLFPYGLPAAGVRDIVLPATARRLAALNDEEESRAYLSTWLRVYYTKVVDHNLGKRATEPTYGEVKGEVDALFLVRSIAAYTLPVPLGFQSPYQSYIDAYRKLREEDPEHADELFYDKYGPEFWPLTLAVTRSVDGVPPTLEAWKLRKEHEDLIEEFPEYGGLIVGKDGAGEFNKAVWEFQMTHAVKPGSEDNQRRPLSIEEGLVAPEVNLGWLEFSRAMRTINAELEARGLSNLAQKEAADLRALKKDVITGLSREHPAWYDDYNQVDRGKWGKRINALTVIAEHPKMQFRDDIRGLREYLDIRTSIVTELSAREAVSLDAKSNKDLADLFETATSDLVRQNPAFESLFNRWLVNDQLQGERESG